MNDVINQTLLIIAPHPDDEVIGCGGLIQKVKENNGKVFVLFLTNGDTKDFTEKGLSTKEERDEEIESAAKFLGYDDYEIFFKGNNYHLKLDLAGQMEVMEAIERKSAISIEKVKPTILASPSPTSYNQDHRMASYASHAALRPGPQDTRHNVKTVLHYEEAVDIWSLEKLLVPNFLIDLSKDQIEKKLSALSLYKSQDRPFPNMRSTKTLKALSILRGSQRGTEFAEGFYLTRHLA